MIKIEELSPPERIAAKMFQEVIPKWYVLGIILSICAIVIWLIYGMSGILIGIIDMIFDTSFLASLENFWKQYYDIFWYIIMIPLCLIVWSFVIIWNSLRFWVIHFEKTVEDILSSTHDNFPEIVSKMEKIRRQMYFYRPVQILIWVCASPKSFTLLQSYLHECI